MGQYYKAIFLTKKNRPKAWIESYDFGSGAKLMEHSWMPNPFVRFVENQLIVEPQKLVWAGDYADEEKDLTKEEIKFLLNPEYEATTEKNLKENGANLYDLKDMVGKLTHDEEVEGSKYEHEFKRVAPLRYKYLINYDKKEFVDKLKTPKDESGWQIHPLPLLTCEGNGRGGGDFRGDERNLVGRWSRDTIGVVSRKSDIPKDFKEIIFDLVE